MAFWNAQRGTTWFQEHPLLNLAATCLGFAFDVQMAVEDSLEHFVPLVIHGDDADAHRRRSFNVLTVSSALTSGSPWDTKLLVYAMDNSRACTETFDTLNAWAVWSLTELRWMSVDPWNQPMTRAWAGPSIAGPYKGVVVQIKGDEKWLQKALKLVPSGTSHWVCPICRACKDGEFVYTAYGPFAPHRKTRLTTAEFRKPHVVAHGQGFQDLP